MEDLLNEVYNAAKLVYNDYSKKGLTYDPPFRGIGIQYFKFAKEEPKLFEILFMKQNTPETGVANILFITHNNYDEILRAIQDSYKVSEEQSRKIFETMWLVTHGLACLHVTGTIHFEESEVEERIVEIFSGVLLKIKTSTDDQ